MIKELELRIKELNQLVNGRKARILELEMNLGKYLYQHPQDVLLAPVLLPHKEQADRINQEIPEWQKTIQNINKKIKRDETIGDQLGQIKLDRKSLQDQARSFFVEIGKAAWIGFKDSASGEEITDRIFNDLKKAEEKIRTIDNELYQLENNQEGSFFSSLLQKSRILYLSSRRKGMAVTMASLYRRAGEEFCNTPQFDELAKSRFSDLADSYFDNKNRLEKLDSEERRLKEESRDIRDELKTLCEGHTAKKRIAEIEETIKEKQNNLEVTMSLLAEQFILIKEGGYNDSQEVTDLKEDIFTLQNEINHFNEEIIVQRARIAVETMNLEMDRKEKRIKVLDEEITQKKTEIRDLKKEITSLESSIKAQQEIIGTAKVLMADDTDEDTE